MRILSGVTDQYIYLVAVDATDYVTRETGLASFTVVRSRNGAADATYTTPTVAEIDAATMPGVYALLLDEDMTIDSGDDSQEVALHITHAGMAPITRTFELYRAKLTAGNTLAVTSGGLGGLDLANVGTLTGPYPFLGISESGTAQSATATTLVGRAAQALADNVANGGNLWALGSTQGYWQHRTVTDYVSATDTFTVDAWDVTPTGTITYVFFGAAPGSTSIPFPVDVVKWNGGAVATPNQTGVPIVDATYHLGTIYATPTVAGVPEVDLTHVAGATTNVSALATNANAIKAKTDSLTFTVANQVDANAESINAITVIGAGTSGDKWRA